MTASDHLSPVQFYHGTERDRAGSIQAHGLQADRYTPGYPVLTTNRQVAAGFARPGGSVVSVQIPHEHLDEYAHGAVPHPDNPGEMRGLRKPLPAGYVHGAETVHLDSLSPDDQQLVLGAKHRYSHEDLYG